MLKLHIAAIACWILLASASPAAPVRLSPASPVSAPGALQVAAYGQGGPQITANGRGFLSVWRDSRRGRDEWWATAMDGSGNVIEPMGHPLPFGGVIAAVGTEYFITYRSAKDLVTVHLDELGYPTDPPHVIGVANNDSLLVASNGQNLAVAQSGSSGPSTCTFASRNGEPLSTVAFPTGAVPLALLVIGDEYFSIARVSYEGQAGVCAGLMRVTTEGVQRIGGPLALGLSPVVAAGTGDGNILIVISDPPYEDGRYKVRSFLINTSAKLLAADGKLLATDLVFRGGTTLLPAITVAWDGNQFLVGYRRLSPNSTMDLIARRVRADGLGYGDEMLLEPGSTTGVAFASCVGTNILEWGDGHLNARKVASFDDLWYGYARPVTVTQTPPAQVDSQLITTPLGPFAIWREPTTPRVLRAALLGSPPVVVATETNELFPAVAASSGEVLIAWAEGGQTDARIRARRVSFDGRVLDPEPFTIASGGIPWEFWAFHPDHVSVASDGTTFLVVWPSGDNFMHSAIVSAGKPGSSQIVGRSDRYLEYQYLPFAVWTGKDYLVTWREENRPPLGDGKFCCPRAFAYRALLTSDGRTHDPTSVPVTDDVGYIAYNAQSSVVVRGADRLTMAWIDQCLKIVNTTLDGTAIGATQTVTCKGLALDPSIALAWNGGELVLAWMQYLNGSTSIEMMRFDQALQALDAEPFQVSPAGLTAFSPSITPIADGVVLSYSVFGTDDGYGGTARVFVRTLAREHEVVPPTQPRRSAARH